MVNQKIVESWLKAASDLTIEIVAPFVLESRGQSFYFVAYVKDFGSKKGTLVTIADDEEVPEVVAEEQGYYWSALDPGSYSIYDREEFVEMLDDWGWFGADDRRPPWYTGKSWS